ncbi:MAG: FtsX-like permease family protein [Geminicoccaceae bacterium]
MNPWPLVAADLRQHRIGAVAIVLLVALAVALGVAVSAQERALRQGSAQAADKFDLIVGAPGSETQLVLSAVYLQAAAIPLLAPSILADLTDDPSVKLASPIGFGDSHDGHPVVGVVPAFVTHLAGGVPAEGRVFERLDEVVVGSAVDLQLGDSFHPTHGMVVIDDDEDHHDFSYRVVGRLPPLGNPWDRAIVGPIEAVWWMHSLPLGHAIDDARLYSNGLHAAPDWRAVPLGPPWDTAELTGVPAIVVQPDSFAAAYQLRGAYRSREGSVAVFPAEVLIQLYGLLGDVRDLLAVISVLTQVLVIGAVLLAVLASLAQRRRLIAVLRALGASRGFVFATVWLSVALMLATASLLGLGLGYIAALALSRVFAAETSIALPVSLAGPELMLVLAIVVIGLLLATIPAALTYRGSVSAGLRA